MQPFNEVKLEFEKSNYKIVVEGKSNLNLNTKDISENFNPDKSDEPNKKLNNCNDQYPKNSFTENLKVFPNMKENKSCKFN